MGISALRLIGILYTVIGGVSLPLGAAIACYGRAGVFLLTLGGIGSIFLVLGILFLAVSARRRKKPSSCWTGETISGALFWRSGRTGLSP